ncbi:cysteine--tRNA ligase [Tindallia californiensis]|uniref:Cysteine--tRNA ligase n=1 Tax=Tindallia californiensis TaxID=159292 RepID=A0A1H3R939_9FIRM|nr:cysteine--tRNA ligase [Tindallia californiensis]SDZ22023.1 cysteinyl-tRNA synthetase [Tindallia californiensis]
MKLFNTLTRSKETFYPIEEGKIKMYACGPTVYNYFHIGNARTFITFDAMRNYFKYRGYEVILVQNFTDVDDKIIQQASKESMTPEEISLKYIKAYFEDAESLGIQKADIHPRVTENIPEIIAFVEALILKKVAYEMDGDVYFDVSAYPNYGRLSKQSLEELKAGARIEVNENKKNPLDFALWKKAKPGEPYWESPWGKGRPGWHIECSAMAKKYLGDTIDIHGGGGDLTFPHHENEVAQSEALTGKPFANYWLHVGYLNVDNRKMSKSLNNFFTPREISEKYDLEVARFFILSAHYRSPLNFNEESMEAAKQGLERLYNARDTWKYYSDKLPETNLSIDDSTVKLINEYRQRYIEVMDDDFNTADGISVIFELVKTINSLIKEKPGRSVFEEAVSLLQEQCHVLGLLQKNRAEEVMLESEILEMIRMREKARKEKNYAKADEIRDDLKNKGIVLEDTPEGVKWKKR